MQGRRLKECRQKQQSLKLSTLALEFLEKSAKHQFRSRVQAVGLFLIIPIIGTYFGFREIQLNADKRLLQNCPEQKENCSGRREALERLIKAGKSLAYFNLNNANLNNVNLNDTNLTSANLNNAKLNNVNLDNANLNNAKLNNANLTSANLNNANLNNANLNNANLSDANLNKANLSDANLNKADLTSANLIYANLNKADLNKADLSLAKLIYANLTSANLNNVFLFLANLTSANLTSANLNKADLNGANLRNAYLIDTKNLTPAQIKSACNWDVGFYKGYYDDEKEEWIIDEEANKAYIEELKQDKFSDPKTPPDCSKWE